MSTKTVLRVEVGFSTQTGVKWVEVRTAADYRHLVRNHGNPVGLRYWDDTVSIMQNRPQRDELALSNSIPAPQTIGLLSTKSGAGAPTGTDAAPMAFVVTMRHDGMNAVLADNSAEDPRLWGKMVAADDLPTYRAGGEQQGMMETIRQIIREATFALDVQENVKVGYNGPNGTRWFICDTPRKYHRIVRFLGMPAHVGTIEPEPGKDYRVGTKGLVSERSRLIPRTVGSTRKGTETGQFVTTKTNVFTTGSSDQPLAIGEIATLRVTCGKCGYSIRKCACADKPSEIMLKAGTTVYTTHGRALRYAPPEKWKDGTLKDEPDFYGVYGESRKNSPKVGREDMNRATEAECIEVRLLTRKMARARDLQRIRTRSDMGRVNDDTGRKPDGADMQDAMQDSVILYAQGLAWAQTLTESSYSVKSRQADAWWYIPRKYIKMAAEADIAGIEVDPTAYARKIDRRGLMWAAARNALRKHFTEQDAQARLFRAMMLVEGKEVEYEQTIDEGAPGTSWGMSLRTKSKGYKSGGTVAKPQYVGIAALRTSQDNPYSAETFQTAVDMVGGWDNLPTLRELMETGMNDPNLNNQNGKDIMAQVATNRMEGFMATEWQQRTLRAQGRAEWDILSEALDVARDLTDRHNAHEQGMAEGKDSK